MEKMHLPVVLLLFFLWSLNAGSQPSFTTDVRLAETNFALQAQIRSVKEGFLSNLDTGAIGINKSGFINLYQAWAKQPSSDFVLLWEPKSVVASSNGMWGITNGPSYTFDSVARSLRNKGLFFTIWQRKSIAKPYKVLLDTGVPLEKSRHKDSASSMPLTMQLITLRGGKSGQVERVAKTWFYRVAGEHSLASALREYCFPFADILLQGPGRIKTGEMQSYSFFSQPYTFTRLATKSLDQNNAILEYGSYSGRNPQTDQGYFLHVWVWQEKDPMLVAAVYKSM